MLICGLETVFCEILGKDEAAFQLCLKSLPEAKVKKFGLIPLAEEISKQPTIDSVCGY